MRDLGDIADDISFSEKRTDQQEVDGMFRQLEELGAGCYLAFRTTKLVAANWVDKSALPFTIGYLTVVPSKKVLSEMMVPRRGS
ncbi:hypothetical protein ABID19_006914 [Mesorhizobium robiniae]|uniref:Uncharacterized protein n=1 Tax=Mesorhizobium robiniae TaxID=559315 RepID=A0ABV2GZY3_9HYPH|nr:hypothetical protein [Mesorhizobium sp. ZC-5]MCV3244112.1 hypothetical protein [Mesorhizobium sp. ZC-5]